MGSGGSGNPNLSGPRNTSATVELADILHSLGEKDVAPDFLIRKSNQLVELLQDNEHLKQDLMLRSIIHKIQNLLLNTNSIVTGCGFRVLRYLLNDIDSLVLFNKLNLDLFIVHSLGKDDSNVIEREEALRLLRVYLQIEGGADIMPLGCVRSIVSVIENIDDSLRIAAVETLCEICLLKAELAYKANGIKTLIQYLIEGPTPLLSVCLVTLIKMLEVPSARYYVLDERLLQLLISPFMDIVHVKIDKLQTVAYVITCLLKSWPGLIAFSQNDFNLLSQLINCLTFDVTPVRNILVQIFSDLFRVKLIPWVVAKDGSSDSILLKDPTFVTHQIKVSLASRSNPEEEDDVVNHYTALLLHIALKCDIISKLEYVFEKTMNDPKQSKRVVILLSEILYLKSYLIPQQLNIQMAPSFKLNDLIYRELRKHHTKTNEQTLEEFNQANGNVKTKFMTTSESKETGRDL
ncbi:unnamed protein product [Ambrosiozyma monospora]|uniref:Unnamed protein product n=1 Tax=Ambrosiozyma monospora TaxID=43982 RepID=A0ACB5TRU7_AMBMO|nr:unnamed protein product [Ambrosiozyma monospora]